ncbi:MAG: crossover junction endodeoxyribonuclease RuvC, partial [Candidatus Omnitrophica bacterium]|nr:crossover junction endodeoxyribonuclease RuvC [Candidatus Omnitrophota bacterium]
MRILGIDPGLAITGYGLIESFGRDLKVIEAGVIRSDVKDKIEKRLLAIYRKVTDLVKDTAPQVAVL